MDFAPSPRAQDYLERTRAFLEERVYPAESVHARQRAELDAQGRPHDPVPVLEDLKRDARARGLWNLFLPEATDPAHGLTVTDYAHVAALTGRSPQLAPEALNCSAPDTGNMEVLHHFGTEEQRRQWLEPLLDGTIRSCFGMTEPDVASSDATNIALRIAADGDDLVLNGRKWWISGAADPRCEVMLVLGLSDPDAPRYFQHSLVAVPLDTPGVEVVRDLTVLGFTDQQGHCEVQLTDVRVPAENLVGERGGGFLIGQSRLGPGRIHHCMRLIGLAERVLEAMVERAGSRVVFGARLAEQGVVQEWIAESRMEIEQARLLTLKTAWLIDTVGAGHARTEIAAIKVVAPRMTARVVDRAIQLFGAAGVGGDTPLAGAYAYARALRLADGPDEVHLASVARTEIVPYLKGERRVRT